MNADAFRHFYEYHFTENRKLWDAAAQLSAEQFTQPAGYSRGSVRDQIVHLMEVDEVWFSELQNLLPSEPLASPTGEDRETIRARWDLVEEMMRAYLSGLQDDMLFEKAIREPDEDGDLIVW